MIAMLIVVDQSRGGPGRGPGGYMRPGMPPSPSRYGDRDYSGGGGGFGGGRGGYDRDRGGYDRGGSGGGGFGQRRPMGPGPRNPGGPPRRDGFGPRPSDRRW